MSRIDDLIQELCPDGVEYRSCKKAFKIISAPKKIKRESYGVGTKYPIIDQGQSRIAGFTDDEDALLPVSAYVLFGDHTREIKYADFAFAQGADGLKILLPATDILPRYAYHAVSSLKIPSRGYNRHWSELAKLSIPIPPLEVQEEIVRVLDSFAELEAELEARRAQYAYYRDKLLDFTERESVSWLILGEIASISTGGGKPEAILDSGAYAYINAGTTPSGFVDAYNTLGNTVTTPSRGQGGIGFIGYLTEPFWCGPLCYRIRPLTKEVMTRFLYHYLSANRRQIMACMKEGGTPAVNRKDLVKIKIPIPPLSEQQRIVDILDRFDALTTLLTDGLPAEIEARRKQYEYYRDKLLSFPEKGTAA